MAEWARRAAVVVVAVAAVACAGGDDTATTGPTTTTVDLGADTGDGTLTVSTAAADPAVRAAVELARQDIDAAGGVLGETLRVVDDSSPGVDVLVSPVPEVGVLSFVTAPAPAPPDDGLVVSTLPAPPLRAAAAAIVVGADDDIASVAVLPEVPLVAEALEAGGRAIVAAASADEVVGAGPDGVVLADPGRAAEQLGALVDAGYTTADHAFVLAAYRVDQGLGFAIGDRPGVLEGVRAVQPGAEVDEDLRARLTAVAPDVVDFTGAPEAYDAVVIAALSSEAVGTDDPGHVEAGLVDVTRGGDTCTSYADCRSLLGDGVDVVYAGLGGSYALGEDGTPTRSAFTVFEYGADNLVDPNRTEYLVADLG